MLPYVGGSSSNSNAKHSQKKQQRMQPNYAIVHLPVSTNVLHFYQLLLENGFPEVSFVNEVRENAFLPSISGVNGPNSATSNQQKSTQKSQQISTNGLNNIMLTDSATIANAIENARALLRHHLPQKQSANSQNNYPPQQSTSSSTQIGHSRQQTAPQLPIQDALHQIVSQSLKQQQIAQQPQSQHQFIALSGSSQNSSSPASIAAADSPSTNQAQGMEQQIVEAPNNNGQKQQQNDELAICLLCNNRIMSTRLSNLTNHVRRHASMKQYRCCHCEYSHNEMAKVRLHMSHNHRDFDSQPVDQLTFEMQLQWGLLMEQCFPEHAKRFGPSAANSQFRCLDQLQKCVDLERSYACIECGELVPGYKLINHLEDSHKGECAASACAECGYESSSQWKVRLHISVKHVEKAADVTVEQREQSKNPMIFLHKFFSEIQVPWLEEEEANLVAELRDKNVANQNERPQSEAASGNMREEEEDGNENQQQQEEDNGINEILNNLLEIGPKKNDDGKSGTKFKEEPREMATTETADEGDNREMMMTEAEQQQKEGIDSANTGIIPTERMSSLNSRKRERNMSASSSKIEANNKEGEENLTPKKRRSLRQSNRIMQMQQKQQKTSVSGAGNAGTLQSKRK